MCSLEHMAEHKAACGVEYSRTHGVDGSLTPLQVTGREKKLLEVHRRFCPKCTFLTQNT